MLSLKKSSIFKNYLFSLTLLVLVLAVFYASLLHFFEEFFIYKFAFKYQFTLYYLLFSSCCILIFSLWILYIYKQVFIPIPYVLKTLSSLYNPKDNEQTYIGELPDFWSVLEDEILQIQKSFGRRQKQGERIRKAIEQILEVFPEPTIIVDNNGQLKYLNKGFKKEFILAQESSCHISEVFREPEIFTLIAQGDNESGEALRKEIQISSTHSPHPKTYIVFKTPFVTRNEDGSYDQLVIFHDITQMRRTDQMKADFVSNVSHELRTPLTAISGYMQTLKEDIANKKYEHVDKFLEIIESHTDRLHFLINDLLELSYLESESVNINKTKISPKQLTEKVLKLFSLDLAKGSYSVIDSYDADTVFVEERLTEQVMINLLQNALRHTPSGTEIQIQWKKSETGFSLLFKDNGPGISEEHVNRIFERFYRVDPHRSRTRGGTGLGLSIVKHIMQRHGGNVFVNSKLGSGLEFECFFPY